MIQLTTQFRFDDFDFQQLKRVGDVALFIKTKPHFLSKFYEVVVIQKRPAHTWPNGATTPAHESMPGNEQWGTSGWSESNLKAAEARFSAVLKSHQNRRVSFIQG